MLKVTTKVLIFDRGLKTFKGSYPFDLDTLTFDIETEVHNTMKLLHESNSDVNFLDIINQGDWITFIFEGFRYDGAIIDYTTNDNTQNMDIKFGLNYDAIDYNFELDDLTIAGAYQMPQLNELFTSNPEKVGAAGNLLLYGKRFLSMIINKDKYVPNFYINDITTNKVAVDEVYLEDTTFAEYARYLMNIYKIGVSLKIKNNVFNSTTRNILDISQEKATRYVEISTYDINYIPLEIDFSNANQVISDFKTSFQSDRPNFLQLEILKQSIDESGDFGGEWIQISLNYLVLCKDGIVRFMQATDDEQLPDEFIVREKKIRDNDVSISTESILSIAVSEIGNSYTNEITFISNTKGLGMEQNSTLMFNFYEMLGRPVSVKLTSNKSVLSRITKLKVKNGGLIEVTLGVSRKRMTDKLRKITRRR